MKEEVRKVGKLYRWVDRTDPLDGTTSITVEKADSENDKPEKVLHYDPDRMRDPVELEDNQVAVLSRYAILEDSEAPDPDAPAADATTDPNAKKYSREELEAMTAEDIRKLAGDLDVKGRSGKNQDELVELILKHQEGGGS